MNEANESELETRPAQPEKTSLFSKPRLMAAAIGLGGMVLGSVVGLGVQLGVESTGLLGPSVESLIAEQKSNFNDVHARLDALKNMSTDKEVKNSLTELGKLLARQDELARHANAELAYLGEQVSALRDQQLAEAGFAGGADVWLKQGESINVGNRKHVFGLLGARATYADINLDGTRKRVSIGDPIPVPGDDTSCTLFFKQATPRADGRIGFDLTCS